MIQAIESQNFKISKNKEFGRHAYCISIKEPGYYIKIFDNEFEELLKLLEKSKEILQNEE